MTRPIGKAIDLTDRELFEVSLSEYLKRRDLNPIEKANALKQYMDTFNASSKHAARLLGIPEGTIRGIVRLLNLPEEDQQKLKSGELSQRQAREFLKNPETGVGKADEINEDTETTDFNLKNELCILAYGQVRDVSDKNLFHKIRLLVEDSRSMAHQLELMNQRRQEG